MRDSRLSSAPLLLLPLLLLLLSQNAEPHPYRNDDETPHAPQSDVVTNLDLYPEADIIEASWQFENQSGNVVSFRVIWQGSDWYDKRGCRVKASEFHKIYNTSTDCPHDMKLRPNTNYTVLITPINSSNVASGVATSKTSSTFPVDKVTNLLDHSALNTIQLTWELQDPSGDVVWYRITWQGRNYTDKYGCRSKAYTNSTTQTSDDCHKTRKLQPNSPYVITVTALNNNGQGVGIPAVISARTLMEDMVSNLQLVQDRNMIHASWTLKYPSGKVRWYDVAWLNKNLDKQWCLVKQNGSKTTFNTDQCLKIPTLQPCSKYTVIVTAQDSDHHRIGNASSELSQTKMGAPPAPTSVSCIPSSDGQDIFVAWVKPSTACSISNYEITWTGSNFWSSDKPTGKAQFYEPTLMYIFNETLPSTSYNICVTGVVQKMFKGTTTCCNHKTKLLPPTPPRNLKLLEATSNSLTIQWEKPKNTKRYKISEYVVSWAMRSETDQTEYNKQSKHVPTADQEGSFYRYTIEDLEPRQIYNVCVKANPSNVLSHALFHTKQNGDAVIIGGLTATIIILLLLGFVCFLLRDKIQDKINKFMDRRPKYYIRLEKEINSKIKIYERRETLNSAFKKMIAVDQASDKGSTTDALLPENKKKNRHISSLPFDHNRVKLCQGQGASDYINASNIPKDGYRNVEFIACQSPMKDTVEDFWRMVWEQDVDIIVMLCVIPEHQKFVESINYWPLPSNCSLKVDMGKGIKEKSYVKNEIVIEKDAQKKVVKHFFFEKWSDGLATSRLEIVHAVRMEAKNTTGRIVVHCSTGEGRTGFFIALWTLISAAEEKKAVEVDNVIQELRKHRKNLVAKPAQFRFLHVCFAEYLKNPKIWKVKDSRNAPETEEEGAPLIHMSSP